MALFFFGSSVLARSNLSLFFATQTQYSLSRDTYAPAYEHTLECLSQPYILTPTAYLIYRKTLKPPQPLPFLPLHLPSSPVLVFFFLKMRVTVTVSLPSEDLLRWVYGRGTCFPLQLKSGAPLLNRMRCRIGGGYRCSGGLLASGLAFKSLQDISEPKIKDKSADMLCSLQDVDHLHAHK